MGRCHRPRSSAHRRPSPGLSSPISRIADIWGRGAYLVNPQFSGDGDAELAIELGLGVAVGFSSGRFRIRTDYEFQRIDRKVNQIDVPIEIALARLGLEVGF